MSTSSAKQENQDMAERNIAKNVFNEYRDVMLIFLDKFDNALIAEAKKHNRDSSDFDRAIMAIWKIISYNVFSLVSDFQDKRKFYSIASSARLIMECLADSKYLAANQLEAREYWRNQEKIREDLSNRGTENWQAFVTGSVNKYGELREPTKSRIKNTLGDDAMGSYNFLCFFTHSNVAAIFWLNGDNQGYNAKYVLQITSRLLAHFILLVEERTSFEIQSDPWLKELNRVFSKLNFNEPAIKL